MKKVGLLGTKKRGKTLEDYALVKDLIKAEVGGNTLSIEDDGIVEYGWTIDKRGKLFYIYELYTIHLFINILRFSTNMRRLIADDMFEQYPSIILCNDLLEGLVGGEWSRD